MYGHPQNPDPWAEIHEGPAYQPPASDPSGFTVGCLVVAVPTFAFAFTAGYLASVWGWL